MTKECERLREDLEKENGKILTYLIDCPFCKYCSSEHCKICDNKKKVHAVFVGDEYKAVIIYNRN